MKMATTSNKPSPLGKGDVGSSPWVRQALDAQPPLNLPLRKGGEVPTLNPRRHLYFHSNDGWPCCFAKTIKSPLRKVGLASKVVAMADHYVPFTPPTCHPERSEASVNVMGGRFFLPPVVRMTVLRQVTSREKALLGLNC